MAANRYPKAARLRTAASYKRILREGLVHPGRECVVRVRPNGANTPRLGTAVPWRYGNAVRRNRFRRVVREAFRLERAALASYDFFLTPRKVLDEPTLAGVTSDLRAAQRRARRAFEGEREAR
jgi:ribonuclease P protein component